MTTRDLSPDDIDGFMKEFNQRQEETRFAQLDDEWTPATTLEDVAILLVVTFIFGIGAFALGWAIWSFIK